MLASSISSDGTLDIREWPEPRLNRAGEIVVQMLWSSICGSDLHVVYDGRLSEVGRESPGYPGHEGVGVIISSDSAHLDVGEKVLTLPQGQLGGCWAERQVLHESQAIRLPQNRDDRRLLMAQQYGTVIFAMKRFLPETTRAKVSRVAVIYGAGSAGLFFLQECLRAGFENVIVSEPVRKRRNVAQKLGANVVTPQNLTSLVKEQTRGIGADLVIEAVGRNELRNESLYVARHGGTVGLYGLSTAKREMIDTHQAFYRCLNLQFAVGAQSEPRLASFHEAIRRIEAGEVQLDYCLGHEFGLRELPEALEAAKSHDRAGIKALIRIGERTQDRPAGEPRAEQTSAIQGDSPYGPPTAT